MGKKTVLFLFALSLLFCVGKKSTTTSSRLSDSNEVVKSIALEKVVAYKNNNKEHFFSSIAYTSKMDFFAFDKNQGLIIKFDKKGNILKSIGGIGKGPDEFITEINSEIILCDDSSLIAYDWSQARYHLYDLDLKLIKMVQIDSVPYKIACGKPNEILILYNSVLELEILNLDGRKIRTIKFTDDPVNNLNSIKHVLLNEENYFFGYYFQPLIKIYKPKEDHTHILSLEYREGVNTAIRSISKSKNIHFFYNDNNPSYSASKRKKGIVLDSLGKYKFTYHVPDRINYYEVTSQNIFIAIEDSMTKIVQYNFKIDG